MSEGTMFYAVHNCSGMLDPDAPINEPKCPFYDADDGYCSIMERYDGEEGLELPKDCILLRGDILVFIAKEKNK